MIGYDWAFDRLLPYLPAFLSGTAATLALSIVTIFFFLIVGGLWGAALARSTWIRTLTLPGLDVLKALPPLVLVLFGYFLLTPATVGIAVPSFLVFVLFVGLNLSAFAADLIRAAILNVPHQYIELGKAFGFTERRILRSVVAPIAIREAVPGLSYLGIETIKLTSLVSIINGRELVYVAQGVIVVTSRSLEVWALVSLIYVALIWPTNIVVRRIELHMKRSAGVIR